MSKDGLIERYREFLPVSEKTPVVSLGEGDTPLVRAANIEKDLGGKLRFFVKFEGSNPTGSFKDRGMTVAISKAVEAGSRAVICASTGNTSASAAAYSARAGITCAVLIPAGNIALGKLAQAVAHGARVIAVKGGFDAAFDLVREISKSHPIQIVNSVNPDRIEGQKTGAFEICEALGDAPDYHCIPVGNAGNITAYWKGYREWKGLGRSTKTPKMIGAQASGADPIVRGKPVREPKTVATAIRIGNPARWKEAEAARDESGGDIVRVTDAEITKAWRLLAVREGLFVEPASAAGLAGFMKKLASGEISTPATVVCVTTGHGLKDPDFAVANGKSITTVKPDMKAVLKAMGLNR